MATLYTFSLPYPVPIWDSPFTIDDNESRHDRSFSRFCEKFEAKFKHFNRNICLFFILPLYQQIGQNRKKCHFLSKRFTLAQIGYRRIPKGISNISNHENVFRYKWYKWNIMVISEGDKSLWELIGLPMSTVYMSVRVLAAYGCFVPCCILSTLFLSAYSELQFKAPFWLCTNGLE